MNSIFGNSNKPKEVIFNFYKKHEDSQHNQAEDNEISKDEQLQCFNCLLYFDPKIYGIDLLNEMDFNKNLDTFCCENCYLSLHFPFYYQQDLLLKINNLEVNSKYEFNLILEDCFQDSCILGVFLTKQNLINIFKKQSNSQNFILNSKMNGKDPNLEGYNFFIVDSNNLTQMQNTLNFECLNFSYQKRSINSIILMSDQQKSQLKTVSPNILSIILHCREIRVSTYVARLFKKKFFNCLNHESLFKVFQEQELKYKQKDQIQKVKLESKQNDKSMIFSDSMISNSENQQCKIQSKVNLSQISINHNQQTVNQACNKKKELTEIFLRIKNFHQIFPFMYKNEMVVKMDDDAVIQFPAFTYHHSHPFDLRDYCYINQINPTWLCPICNKHKIFLKEIQLDFYLFALIQTQFMKDSKITNKIEKILQNKPQFDSEFFTQKLKQLNLHSIKILEQNQKKNLQNDSQTEEKSLNNKNFSRNNINLSQIQNKFLNINFVNQVNTQKNMAKNQYFKTKSCIDQNVNQEQRSYKSIRPKSKTSEFLNENRRNWKEISDDHCLNFFSDFDEFQSFLNPFQKSDCILNLNSNQSNIQKSENFFQKNVNLCGNNNDIINDENISQKKSSRVYSKLINKSKSKTNSSNVEQKNQQEMLFDKENTFTENKIEIEQPEKEQNLNNDGSESTNNNSSKNDKTIQFNLQIESISDLKQKQSEEILEVANYYYLDTSFLRSPLEINVIFDLTYYNQYGKEDKEFESIQQIIELVDFQEDSLILEKIFNIETLYKHQFIFNIFNLNFVNSNQYQNLYIVLNENPSTKTFFQVLIHIQNQFVKYGISLEFYNLLSSFYFKIIQNKQRNDKNCFDLIESQDQITSSNYSQNKNFLEKLIECFLSMSIFRQQGKENVIENFQQMLLEYMFFKQQNIPTLINIHNIIMHYFPNQCHNIIESIKKSLNSLNICI